MKLLITLSPQAFTTPGDLKTLDISLSKALEAAKVEIDFKYTPVPLDEGEVFVISAETSQSVKTSQDTINLLKNIQGVEDVYPDDTLGYLLRAPIQRDLEP